MNWKKAGKYFVVIFAVAAIVFVWLANRDLDRMYGGLTKAVDTSQFKPPQGPLSIYNVSVLSPDGERFIVGQTVSIENGRIVAIEDDSQATERTAISVNGTGKYLIPGLTDAHVHLFKSPNDLLLYVANGVTQIRELIGEQDHLRWRKAIQRGRIGPDMFIASPRIGSFEALQGWFMSWSQGYLNLSDAKQAERAVKKLHQQGYDAVKVYSQINEDTYRSVSRTARALGMKVVGHVPWRMEMTDIYAGHDSIAHLEELMNGLNREFGGFSSKTADEFLDYVKQRSDGVSEQLLQHNVAVSTTLWLVESFVRQKFDLDTVLSEVELAYENPGISEWSERVPQGGLGWLPGVNRYQVHDHQTAARAAASRKYWQTYSAACRLVLQSLLRHGVRLMTGTDANLPPAVPGFSLHDEFVSLNRAGMSPARILRAATAEPAAWLNNDAGILLPGKKANLVLLNKNPLLDIGNTRAIDAVILNGRLLDRSFLDRLLSAVKNSNDASRTVDISAYLN